MADRAVAIICLGEVLFDRVVNGQGESHDFPGGAPANVAVALARLGMPVALVGAVGQDDQGRALTQVLNSNGVDCRGLQTVDAPTRVVEVRCTANGDRSFGGFIGGLTGDFADTQLSFHQLRSEQLSAAQVLVTGTLGLAHPATRAAMQRAAADVQARGGKLVIDVNWRPTFWPDPSQAMPVLRPWLQRADLIKVAADEAISLWETNAIAELSAQFPQAKILLTDGDRGCQFAFGEHRGQVPAFAVPAVETTGAGDAFLAGMVYQCLQHDWQFATPTQLARAVQFANAMGALTTLKAGAIAALPTVDILLDFLQTQTGQVWTMGRV